LGGRFVMFHHASVRPQRTRCKVILVPVVFLQTTVSVIRQLIICDSERE